MAIKEYEPGTAFPGVMGRTVGESSPAWPGRCAPSPERPTCSTSSSTTPASGSSAATARRSARPTSTGWPRTACATTTCTRPRSARRRRSCMLTGRNHHSNAMACITEGATGYPGLQRRSSRSRTASCPRCCCRTATTRIALGKWHLTPAEQMQRGRPVRSLAARPRLRALLRLPGRRHHQYYPGPRLRQPSGRAAEDARGGLPPHRGPGRPGDRVHRRRQAGRARQAVLPVLLHRAPMHAPHHVPKRMGRQVQGQVRRRLGRLPREGVRAAEGARHRAAEDASCRAHDPDVAATGTSCRADEKRLYARMMEVFAGFLEHTDHHIGRLLDFLEEIGELDNTLIMVDLATTAPAPRAGRTARSTRTCSSTTCPRRCEENLERDRRPRRARSTSTTTRGAGRGPATRRSGAGSARPTAAASPIRSSSTGRRASRPRARSATSTRTPSTWCRRCWTRSASSRRRRSAASRSRRSRASVVRAHVRRRQGARRRHHTQYFEMFGHRAIYHDGWRAVCPVPGPSFTEAGMGFGEMVDHRGQAARARRQGLGALPRRRGLLGDQEPRRRAPRQADRDDRALVRRGGQVQRAADRQPRHGAPRRRAAAARAAAQPLRLLPAHVGGLEQDRAAHAQPAAQHHRDGRDRRTAPRACWSRRAATSGGYALYVKDHKLHYAYNYLGVQQFHLATDATVGDGRHELRFEFEPTGKPDLAQRQGDARRTRSSTSTASWPARATCRSPSRSTSASPKACRAGATTARR